MPEKYVKRTNFWENLTSLDSSHLKVFLGNFWKFFIFLNLNLNFEFGPVWYRPKSEPGRTSLTGYRSNRTDSHQFCKPWKWYEAIIWAWLCKATGTYYPSSNQGCLFLGTLCFQWAQMYRPADAAKIAVRVGEISLPFPCRRPEMRQEMGCTTD